MQRLRPVFLFVLVIAVLLSAWVFPPDATARRDTQAGLERAVATFAAARALHAVLSVAQGTQIAVEPGGVGAVFAPGQALKPVTELLEQFSSLMLAACVAFGVQLLLLNIGGHVAVSAVLSLLLAAWALARWRDAHGGPSPLTRRLASALVLMLLVRFAVPLLAMGNEVIYRVFLQQQYTEAKAEIAPPADVRQPEVPAAERGLWDTLKDWVGKGRETLDQARIGVQQVQATAARAVDHLLRLLAVFVLQTVVFPLLFLWGLWRAFGLVVGSALGGRAVQAR